MSTLVLQVGENWHLDCWKRASPTFRKEPVALKHFACLALAGVFAALLTVRAEGLGICFAAPIPSSQPLPKVQLSYARQPGTEGCPAAGALRAAVAARLGYDPFEKDAETAIVARVAPASNRAGLLATIEVQRANGATVGTRNLASRAGDCRELSSAMVLAISITIDPFNLGQAPLSVQRSLSAAAEPQPLVSPAVSATPASLPLADAGVARSQTKPRRRPPPSRAEPAQRAVELKQDARLAAERALLERAQAALARRNAAGAIEALRQHTAKFSDGELVEERDVLLVRALVASGRVEEARAQAARFRQQFPKSVFLTAVDTVLRTAPITKTQP